MKSRKSIQGNFASFQRHLKSNKTATVILSIIFSSGALLVLGIRQTKKYIDTIVDTSVLKVRKNTQYIYIPKANIQCGEDEREVWELAGTDGCEDHWFPSLRRWWSWRKTLFLWRLVEMANESEGADRQRAVLKLAAYTDLKDHEYYQLAQACNAGTAVAMARVRHIDKRFFRRPHTSCICQTRKEVIENVRGLLIKMCKNSKHSCLSYFVRKVFPGIPKYKAWSFFSDLDVYGFVGIPPITISDETLIPCCVEALVHHVVACGEVKSLVDSGGLKLLYDCNSQLTSDPETCYRITNILTEVSTHSEFLQDFFQTGWIGRLAEWLESQEARLSTSSGTILANLSGESGSYSRELVLLHPVFSPSGSQPAVDVVLIHGLLGGVHYTWRQRRLSIPGQPISIFGFPLQYRKLMDCGKRANCSSESKAVEMVDGEDSFSQDWDFVMTDLPEAEFSSCDSCFTFDRNDKRCFETMCNGEQTMCWPKDWLPKDCKNLRVLGINYDTRISDWTNWCPLRDRRSNRLLSERCKRLLNHLMKCGIGDKPIVWITHSMGGLVLKHILIQAWHSKDERSRKVCSQTKGAVFLSTPHIGSPWATLHDAWKFLFLPSVEFEELRYQSPVLQNLHQEFLKFVAEYPIEILSFVETKSIKISKFEWEFHCVPPNIGDTGTGVIYGIPLGHMDICKPEGKCSFIYQRILTLVKSAISEPKEKKHNT